MSEFNTHGGYFAPQGYRKVEEGGSHEENPNGGVQVGVDPQGIPNMLEENEPVYNDYVFSDNIEVTKDMAEAHNLPKQLIGKLYSDAVQYFMDEAEQRPMDPISKNGLESMLMRLADAQEEQKMLNDQEKIQNDVSRLSPEELEYLSSIFASEAAQAQEQEVAMNQEVPVEGQMIPEEQMTQQMPIMKYGGTLMRTFQTGGPKDDGFEELLNQARAARELSVEQRAAKQKAYDDYAKANRRYNWRKWFNENWYHDQQAYDTQSARLRSMLDEYASGELTDGPYGAAEDVLRRQYDAVRKAQGRMDKRASKLEARLNELNEAGSKLQQYGTTVSPVSYSQPSVSSANPDVLVDYESTFKNGGCMNKFDGLQYNQPSWLTKPIPNAPGSSATIDPNWKIQRSGLLYDIDTGTTPPVAQTGWRPKDNTLLGWKQPEFAPVYYRQPISTSQAPFYSTLGQYAGPGLSIAQALWDASMEGDRYPMERVIPFAPEARLNLQRQRYTPIDPNSTENANIAQENAVLSAIRNSGAGASTPAAILAADYRGGINRGLGFMRDWQANNTQRNAVIAANNAPEAQEAQFDYGIAAARAQAQREAQRANIQNDLIRRRLENQSDQDYANAFITSARDVANFLGARAKENRAYNMANSNYALSHGAFNNGVSFYRGVPVWRAGCGGFIKKIK